MVPYMLWELAHPRYTDTLTLALGVTDSLGVHILPLCFTVPLELLISFPGHDYFDCWCWVHSYLAPLLTLMMALYRNIAQRLFRPILIISLSILPPSWYSANKFRGPSVCSNENSNLEKGKLPICFPWRVYTPAKLILTLTVRVHEKYFGDQ